ncbi:sugar transferase [Sinorhizobium fredii]|uniref:sugar transferase n=1 Tax=Rhizobium fredii TaxID=380 RepID=UPI00351903C2
MLPSVKIKLHVAMRNFYIKVHSEAGYRLGLRMRGVAWSFRRVHRTEFVPLQLVGGMVKRGFDLGSASLALVLVSPLFLLICVLVMIAVGGPALQAHQRVGRGGRTFNCLEFRATVDTQDCGRSNPAALAVLTRDLPPGPDLSFTPVGTVLVKLGLHKLPQLINVFRGDMSIVGPNPLTPAELKMFGDAAEFYLKSRPGLVRPHQVSGSAPASYADWMALERHYAENWSPVADLRVIAKTVSTSRVAAREQTKRTVGTRGL